MKNRWLLCSVIVMLLIGTILCFTLPGKAASDAENNSFDISEGDITVLVGTNADTVKVNYGGANEKDNIPEAEEIIIIGTTDTNKIVVNGVYANIKLDGVDIQNTIDHFCAFELTGNADVNLILSKTNTLTSGGYKAGLQVPAGTSITIQGEGFLIASGGKEAAGIGGSDFGAGGTISIKGGEVTATGGQEAAGIGGGRDAPGGLITIQDGVIDAIGGDAGGAGIGGGWRGVGGTVTITGGTVSATGGDSGAGIGGGSYRSSGETTISGGKITAKGGRYSAGIGGGWQAPGGTTIIQNGEVTANGGNYGAGIGGGKEGAGGTITITGGTVTATGGAQGAGIGGSTNGQGGTISITAGTVEATGGPHGAGIGGGGGAYGAPGGAGGVITIEGGEISATGRDGGAGIGGGDGGTDGIITINSPAIVKSASDKIGRPAIYAAGGSLEAGSTARVLMANFANLQNANVSTDVYNKTSSALCIDFAPAAAYQSIAFTVPEDTYCLKTTDKYQRHGSQPNTSIDFEIPAEGGLYSFDNVEDCVFSITYILNDGSNNPDNPDTYTYGAGVNIKAPSRDNYIFAGWYTKADFTEGPVSEITTADSGDKTLYAKWDPTYTIAPIENQSMTALTAGYAAGTQEEKIITITRTGSGDLINLAVSLGGNNDFLVISEPDQTLNDTKPSSSFAVKAKDGLAAGNYTATVTVSADNMTDVSFEVRQQVNPSSSGDDSDDDSPSGTPVSPSGKTFTQNGVTLTFPPGATENDIRVIIKKISRSSGLNLPDGYILLSRIIDIIKDKSDNFSKPVSMTLSFDKSKLDSDKYDILICYYDEDTDDWIALDNIIVNMQDGTVSGDTIHFTKFAVIAVPKNKEEKLLPPAIQPVIKIPGDISSHWAKDSVMKVINAGVISGYPDGTFQPDKAITRAEFTVMLVKALNLEVKAGNIFSDTAAHWAKDFISTAAANDLISGYDKNNFGSDDPITREQAAAIIARAAKLPSVTEELNFTDSTAISTWAKAGAAAAVKGGFMNGYPDGSFKPRANMTRAEAAVIIGKLL